MRQWLPHQAVNVVWTSCPLDVRSPSSLLGWKYRCVFTSVSFDPLSTEALPAFTNMPWCCSCSLYPIHMYANRILHWNKLAASWTNQNVSLQAELTNGKNSRSCHLFLVLWCFLALLGISKAVAMASSKQHQILSKGVPAESSTIRTPSDICIAL